MKFALWMFAMSSVAVTWVVMAAMFAGIGRLIVRRTGATVTRLFASHWLGLAVTLAGLQLWSLFLPINAIPLGIVLVIGSYGLLSRGRGRSVLSRVLAVLRGAVRRRPATAAAAAILLIFLANRAIGPADLWDTRMYHINAMRWANAFPVVPGIANLQRNVAFNNANHLLSAMMNVGPWEGRAMHVVAGLFLLPLGCRGLLGLSRALRRKHRSEDLFFAAAFPAVIALAMRPEIASLSSDLPAAVLTFVSIGLMLRLLRRPDFATWLTLLFVFASAVCCKLSTVGLSGMGFLLTAAIPLYAPTSWRIGKSIGVACLVAVLFAVPYMARGVIMSGYPLYPIAAGAADVEWKYPADDLKTLRTWIQAHGRGESFVAWKADDRGQGSAPMADGWVGHWIREAFTSEIDRTAPVLLLLAGLLLAMAMGRAPGPPARTWIVVLPALSATLLWLFTAPAIRFGFAFPWALAGALFATVASRRSGRLIVSIVVVLCMTSVALALVTGKRDAAAMVRKVAIPPGPDYGFHQPVPAPYTTFTSRFGLVVNVPVLEDFCWSAPLPCTHIRNPDLRLRVAGDLGSGFVTDRMDRPGSPPRP